MIGTAFDLAPPGFDLGAGAGRLDCGAAARLAAASGAPPRIDRVTAAFDPSGAVAVEASGEDADADVRSATVRLLDRDGEELVRATEPLTPSGPTFVVALALRSPAAARARAAVVSVNDATGLASAEAQAALACPGDAALGDALCALGDLLDDLRVLAGRRARRLERLGRSAATALSRAGEAETAGRLPSARRALRAAAARIRRIEWRASGLPEDASGVGAEAHALGERLRTLLSALADAGGGQR
jgi:hypothetical protein